MRVAYVRVLLEGELMGDLLTKEECIRGFLKIGAPPISPRYAKELIPWKFARHLVRVYNPFVNWSIGLLALHIGVANWGIDWDGFKKDVPTDPVGIDWEGQRTRRGKHLLDGGSRFPWGGLGIPHLDSSGLYRDAYKEWGEPYLTASDDRFHFNKLIKSVYKGEYFDWADKLLADENFLIWLCNYWLDKFWDPVWRWVKNICASEGRTLQFITADIERATVNSRVSNSVSGVAGKLRQFKIFIDWKDTKPGKKGGEWKRINRCPTNQEQIDTYIGYKHSRRSKRAAKRALEQAQNAQRVAVLYNLFCESAVPIL